MTHPTSTTTVTLDDTNPALIYSDTWITDSGVNEWNNTSHATRTSGATVRFNFHGTFVAVYGTVGADTPISSYALDGTTSIYAAERFEQPVYGQLFYNSPTLDDGEHTLVVTNMGSGALWIDYVVYAPSVSSSSKLASRTVTPTPSQTPGITPGTGLPGSNSKSSIPIPAVVGCAIGALVLIVVLIFGVLYYRRRAKRVAGARLLGKENILDDFPEVGKPELDAIITPFTRAYTSSPHASSGHGSSNMNMYPLGSTYPQSDHDHQHRRQPSTPIYHFSDRHAPMPGYSVSSDNGAGAGTRNGGTGHGSTHLGHPYASSDGLVVPHHRSSVESAESMADLPSDRATIDPPPSLPNASSSHPPNQATPQRTDKDGSPIRSDGPPTHSETTPQLRQHEDGGVRLDIYHPQGSERQEVIDLPPAYRPNY